ncbi:MAG: nucleoside hydrolase [Bacteroidota bacterium]
MRYILIDTDTASDDAVALVMALNHPNIQVEALTVVAGNVPLDQAVQNALYTVALCGKDTPVYGGLAKPLLRELQTAQFIHGKDGLGDIGLPLSGRVPAGGNAIDVILDSIRRFPRELEIIALGPLTNLAIAFAKEPDLVNQVKHCYIMGGVGKGPGNVTSVSEYNIWADPEAAQIVFQSGVPITMIGWDIAVGYAAFDANEVEAVRSLRTPLAKFCMDIQGDRSELSKGKYIFTLPDPIAMAVALDGSIATYVEEHFVEISLSDNNTRGMTLIDYPMITQKTPNTRVVLEASKEKFLRMLHDAVR